MNKKIFYYSSIIVLLISCLKSNDYKLYENYRTQKLDLRDSLYILHTVKEWRKVNWYNIQDYSRYYRMTNDQVEYFIGGAFYSPDKTKLIVWLGEKLPNAFDKDTNKATGNLDKICPTGGDTIYLMSGIIGVRDNKDTLWKLYPFDNQSVECASNKNVCISVMGDYYFEKMKDHGMYRIAQSGPKKGQKVPENYRYNLQDSDFWEKCWLFHKDTVASNNLYPFEIRGHHYNGNDVYNKNSAKPRNPPQLIYPDSILKLFVKP